MCARDREIAYAGHCWRSTAVLAYRVPLNRLMRPAPKPSSYSPEGLVRAASTASPARGILGNAMPRTAAALTLRSSIAKKMRFPQMRSPPHARTHTWLAEAHFVKQLQRTDGVAKHWHRLICAFKGTRLFPSTVRERSFVNTKHECAPDPYRFSLFSGIGRRLLYAYIP